ncbi:hypothetical protein ACJX0J_021750, partial [Zea mays]
FHVNSSVSFLWSEDKKKRCLEYIIRHHGQGDMEHFLAKSEMSVVVVPLMISATCSGLFLFAAMLGLWMLTSSISRFGGLA